MLLTAKGGPSLGEGVRRVKRGVIFDLVNLTRALSHVEATTPYPARSPAR